MQIHTTDLRYECVALRRTCTHARTLARTHERMHTRADTQTNQVRISYGAIDGLKGLLSYGFVPADNPDDFRRLRDLRPFLRRRGTPSQTFLPNAHLVVATCSALSWRMFPSHQGRMDALEHGIVVANFEATRRISAKRQRNFFDSLWNRFFYADTLGEALLHTFRIPRKLRRSPSYVLQCKALLRAPLSTQVLP